MNEFREVLPIAGGLMIGLLSARMSNSWLRSVIVTVLAIAVGFAAAYISGELAISWGYLVFDIAQVAIGIVVAYVVFALWQKRWQTRV